MPDNYQWVPLMWMFDVKKEDKRHKARLVVGVHIVDASSFPICSSVFQNLSIRLPLLIDEEKTLSISTSEVGNTCINAKVVESSCSHAREKWGDESSCALETIKVSCILKNSAREWSFCLGDALRDIGFAPSRCL